MLHKLPEEIEEMDYQWFQDIFLFTNTEEIARKVQSPPN